MSSQEVGRVIPVKIYPNYQMFNSLFVCSASSDQLELGATQTYTEVLFPVCVCVCVKRMTLTSGHWLEKEMRGAAPSPR